VSWGFHLAGDAAVGLSRLPPALQEEVLDEVERLVASPDSLPPALPGFGTVHAMAREADGRLWMILIRLQPNVTRALLTVVGVEGYVGDEGVSGA
jgi:hypothetical protein